MSIFAIWGRKAAKDVVEKELPNMIQKAMAEQLEKTLPSILMENFEKTPDRQLNEAGFNWALYLYLKKDWPDVGKYESVRWLREYLEVPYGDPEYSWTASAAKQLADEYVREFGEA